MSLEFSPLQERCLDALGYTRYALTGVQNKPETSAARSSVRRARATTTDAGNGKLFAAVLRAARIQADLSMDAQTWLSTRGIDSIASLRSDPAAKRALWKVLRMERRSP